MFVHLYKIRAQKLCLILSTVCSKNGSYCFHLFMIAHCWINCGRCRGPKDSTFSVQCSCTCPYEVSSSAVKTYDTRIAGIVSTFCLYLCQHSNIWCSGPTTVAAIPLAGVNVFLSVDIFCQCESFTATQGTATKCYGWWPSQWWLWSPDLGVLQMVFLS